MSQVSTRLSHLLGEMRREKNGAVADFMRFYGARYGLNYGVSLATMRAKCEDARSDDPQQDHKFATLLYQQEVRELRLAAFWLADPSLISTDADLDFWANGIINSEVAEEAAFALLCRCEWVDKWLDREGELLHYAAVMSLAKRGDVAIEKHGRKFVQLLENEQGLLPKAIVTYLSMAIKKGVANDVINGFIDRLPSENGGAKYIREEMSWRLEFRE